MQKQYRFNTQYFFAPLCVGVSWGIKKFPSIGELLDDTFLAVPVVVLLAFFFAWAWEGVFLELRTGSPTIKMLEGGLATEVLVVIILGFFCAPYTFTGDGLWVDDGVKYSYHEVTNCSRFVEDYDWADGHPYFVREKFSMLFSQLPLSQPLLPFLFLLSLPFLYLLQWVSLVLVVSVMICFFSL